MWQGGEICTSKCPQPPGIIEDKGLHPGRSILNEIQIDMRCIKICTISFSGFLISIFVLSWKAKSRFLLS